jgi:lipoprotein-anchoring transpeptidase ErfK/SrfK
MRENGHRVAIGTERLWRVAVLTTAAVIGVTSQANAALNFWSSSDPGVSASAVPAKQQRRVRHHRAEKKLEAAEQGQAKPQGPLIIAVSIAQQKMKIYDASGLFAETPVSTGMPGHSTPMGVFSVIQKHKFHHSNIYSGAPMPYMQRITWSGVAMHAGVLPGRPASHGCIRMPMAFAVKMWNWTKMGARVVITAGEITPASFSHPLLATLKVAPQPVAGNGEKPGASVSLAGQTLNTELRPTLGHEEVIKPGSDESQAPTPSHQPARIADASDTLPTKPSNTMSDAPSARTETSAAIPDVAAPETNPLSQPQAEAGSTNSETAKTDTTQSETATPVAASAITKDQARATEIEKPAAAKPEASPAISKRGGQIAVLISRKDSKLYVRQNFSPLFDVPVNITSSDRPLGTHVFTAQIDKDDANVVHWSVVSLPASNRAVDRRNDDDRTSRRKKIAAVGPVEVKSPPAPDSPIEALDRLNLPTDSMARIVEAISTGGSIIVSDQGIAGGETGEGTDFIISLR